jgi:uncharacterized protein
MAKSYILPFTLYLIGVNVAAWLPDVYPLAHVGVAALVGVATWVLLRGQRVFRPHWRVGEAVLVGLVGIALWIGLSELRLEQLLPSTLRPQPRVGYNPFQHLAHSWTIGTFVAVRLIELVVLVPLAEEMFWRGFLLRWLTSAEWEKVPLGRFSGRAFLIVTLLFTLAHPEWLAAAVYCMLLNGLLYWKKDLWCCVVAHGVSNLVLGLYIVMTGAWWLW